MTIEKDPETLDDDSKELEPKPGAESEGENEDKEKETLDEEIEETGDFDDYVGDDQGGEDKKSDDPFEKRYADSSREAQKIAKERDDVKKDLDELLDVIESDEELLAKVRSKSGNVERKTKSSDNDEVIALKSQLQRLEDRQNKIDRTGHNQIIENFEKSVKKESGVVITKEIRQQMKPFVQSLRNSMPLEEALEIAFLKVNKKGLIKTAIEEGQKKGRIEAKMNADGTVTKTNNLSKDDEELATVTPEEMTTLRKMGVKTDEQLRSYLKRLKKVRGN